MVPDEEKLLMDEIILLTVRERRILQRIQEAKKSPLAISSTVRSEKKRVFDSKEDEAIYTEMVREKVDSGDSNIMTMRERGYDIINGSTGRLYVNGNYLRCYITAGSFEEWEYTANFMSVELTLTTEYPM